MKKYTKYVSKILLIFCVLAALGGLALARGSGTGGGRPPEPPPYACPDGMIQDAETGMCIPYCPFGWNDEGTCNSENEAESDSEPCTSLPELSNFTVTDSSYTTDTVYLELTPNADPGFYLHIQIARINGQDVLSTWCTGNETLCKVVGNGQTCSGENYTQWCYRAD